MIAKFTRLITFSATAFVVIFAFISIFSSNTVYADHPGPCTPIEIQDGAREEDNNGNIQCITDPPAGAPGTGTAGTTGDEEEVSCAVDKIGWIVCPVIEKAAWIGDQAFGFLAGQFLEIEPELVATFDTSRNDTGTYATWQLARNIANVMFVIALLVIIMSQVTGRGIDNYGIKKLVPRLIIAAIAVNISYFICQAMVDLSNILGYETKNFLVNAAASVSDRTAMPAASDTGIQTGTGALAVIAGIVLATVAIVWLVMPLLVSAIGIILATVLIIIIILLMRKAFIILLVVVSPIAFVLYLLPNTEQYFRKWLSMFWKLLMVFPVVGLLFGAGQLASAVILVAGTNGGGTSATVSYYEDGGDKCVTLPLSNPNARPQGQDQALAQQGSCGDRSTPVMLGLVAALIAVAPMLAVWSVLKAALQGAGQIGGKISGAVETYSGKAGTKAQERMNRSAIGRGMEARKAIKKNYQDQGFADKMGKKGFRGGYTRIASRGLQGNVGRVVGGSWGAQDSKLSANFAGAADKLEDQELSERITAMKHGGVTLDNGAQTTGDTLDGALKLYRDAVANNDVMGAKAAESILHSMGGTGTGKWMEATMELQNANQMGEAMAKALMRHTRNKHGDIKNTSVAADEWSTANADNSRTFSEIASAGSTYKNLSGDHVLGQSKESLDAMIGALSNPATSDTERQAMQHAARQAIQSTTFGKAKTGNQARIYDIAGVARPDSLRGV